MGITDNPVKLRSQILRIVEKAGGLIADRETSAGAQKAWVVRLGLMELDRALRKAGFKVKLARVNGSLQIWGKSFEAYKVGGYLFIACYRNGPAGEAYRMGKDT